MPGDSFGPITGKLLIERFFVPTDVYGTCASPVHALNLAAEVEKNIDEAKVSVVFWDERMTSVMAENAMIEADLSRKKRKQKVDSLAAILILQNYLDYLNRG